MPKLSALGHALRLLGYRARTKRELREKLTNRKYLSEAIDEAFLSLERMGLIDDEQFARNYVRDKLAIYRRGPRRIYFELIKHGVNKETADRATKAINKDEELETARSLLISRDRQWVQLDRQVKYRRAIGLLSRRGFSADVIQQALRGLSR